MSTGSSDHRPRDRFVYWFNSQPDPDRSPRTVNNTQDEFTVVLDHPWNLAGTWSVRVLACSLAEVRPDTHRRDLMLYSDVMTYEIVGHDKFPLLDWLPYNSNEYLRDQQSRHPFRRRVARERLESIGFKIVDVTGRSPKFRSRVPTLVCLEFAPLAPSFEDSNMECTLLSNQSRNIYPDNQPSRFTSQLPAIQRLDRGFWEVGIVKLTLPPSTLVKQGDWQVKIKFLGRGMSTTVRVTERPETIDELVGLLNSKIRQNVQTTYLTMKGRGLGGRFRKRRILTKNDAFPPFRVGDRLTVYSPKQLVEVIHEGTGLRLRWARIMQGTGKNSEEIWVLYLDSDNGDAELDVSGTFLERLGFTKPTSTQWQGPITTTGVPEYHIKAPQAPFLHDTKIVMAGVEFSWNPSSKKVKLETGWRDHKMTCLEVSLSEDLAQLFQLTSHLGGETIKGQKWYTLFNCEALHGGREQHASGTHATTLKTSFHVPLPDEYEGWSAAGYKMLNVESLEEVIYDFHHDGTRSRGYVSCDLLDPIMLGDRVTPLMDSIPLQTTFFESQGSVRPGGYVYEPQHVKYYPLSTTVFQSITFTVEDEQGRLLPLDPEGVTTVSVQFRKK